MSDSETIRAVLREHIHDPSSQWNLGTFGAIAEFMRDPGEPVVIIDEPGRLSATTDRGGIGFGRLEKARLFASETAVGTSWSHRIAICLPGEDGTMNHRRVLTELGPDTGALHSEDAGSILFDMGLGALQADICIRTKDPELVGLLRSQAGRSLLEPGNPAMAAMILAVSARKSGGSVVGSSSGGPAFTRMTGRGQSRGTFAYGASRSCGPH